MNTEELRIGNYVWEDYGGLYLVRGVPNEKIINISKTKTTIVVNYKKEDIKPIPLTEEWLLKFGFIQHIVADIEFNEYKKSCIDNYMLCIIQGDKFRCQLFINGRATQTIFECVHHLQNWWFSATLKELTIENEH